VNPFPASSLLASAPVRLVDQTLSRLAKNGELTRLTRGIYVRPKQSKYVGLVMPEPVKIAQAKRVGEQESLQIHGAEAARQFGLTTQVPTTPVFCSSGPSRKFWVGNLRVQVKHVSPRKLALAGTPAGTALSALWYIGRKNISEKVIAAIKEKLPASEFETLKGARPMMPVWMADAIYRYEQRTSR
jgi:hypothetical protein